MKTKQKKWTLLYIYNSTRAIERNEERMRMLSCIKISFRLLSCTIKEVKLRENVSQEVPRPLSYLSIQIQQIESVDTNLNFNLWRISILKKHRKKERATFICRSKTPKPSSSFHQIPNWTRTILIQIEYYTVQDLYQRNNSALFSFMKVLILMNKTLSGRLRELKNRGKIQLGNP